MLLGFGVPVCSVVAAGVLCSLGVRSLAPAGLLGPSRREDLEERPRTVYSDVSWWGGVDQGVFLGMEAWAAGGSVCVSAE